MTLIAKTAIKATAKFGYITVASAVGIESIGIPFPGETTLITAALYAGTSGRLNIFLVVAAAAAGAIIGDNIGFWIGRTFGYRLLLRYGRFIRMTPPRIKLGQYLFLRHGGKMVFFGRFISILRTLAAFLAGANQMNWARFLLFNAAGGILWAAAYGFGAYYLGTAIHRIAGPVGIGVGIAGSVALIVGFFFLKRNETRLEQEAEAALPGPIRVRSQHTDLVPETK